MAKKYKKIDSIEEVKDAPKKLRDKTVTIVGLGGTGSKVLDILVRNGVSVRLIDRGRIKEADMYRQTIFLEDDINRFKAKQAKKRITEANSKASVKAFHEELSEMTNYLLDSDLVVDSSGDEESSKEIMKYCDENDIPVIHTVLSGLKAHVIFCENKKESEKAIKKNYGLDKIPGFPTASSLASASIFNKIFKYFNEQDFDKESVIDSLDY